AGLVLEVNGSVERVQEALRLIAESPVPPLPELLSDVQNMMCEKWDWVLPPNLLAASYASTYLDVESARKVAVRLGRERQ
ncbi:hypothetical protein BZG21_37190, partial [Escherichia coli]|nr:hypothetical protein [Escherichia coli]